MAIYAAAGVVLAAAALLVYRTRHIESAGDVVAVKLVRPVFKYGFAFCTGLTGGMATCSVLLLTGSLSLTVWVLVWSLIGYFAAEMLLKKSFRVLKAWKGSVALGAVMLLLCLSVSLDWYGFENRVPAAGQVESVELWGLNGAPVRRRRQQADLHRPGGYGPGHPAPPAGRSGRGLRQIDESVGRRLYLPVFHLYPRRRPHDGAGLHRPAPL